MISLGNMNRDLAKKKTMSVKWEVNVQFAVNRYSDYLFYFVDTIITW